MADIVPTSVPARGLADIPGLKQVGLLAGVAAAIVTDIARDGAQSGVDSARMEEIAKAVCIPVIASGGVARLDDIRALRTRFEAGVVGVVVGRALYEGNFSLGDAIAVATG